MNWSEWMSMHGHAPYVWGSVGVCLTVMSIEVGALCARSRAARRAMRAAGGEGAFAPFASAPEGGAA